MTPKRKGTEQWRSVHQRMLSQMFAGTLVTKESIKQDRMFAAEWGTEIGNAFTKIAARRRYLLAHSTVQNVAAEFFATLGWSCSLEVPYADFDSNYRFDVVARKGRRTVVVEAKPEVNPREMGQVLAYVHDVEKKLRSRARVFLATDILNFHIVCGEGEVADIVTEYAANHGLGIILVDTEHAWLLPAEVLVL